MQGQNKEININRSFEETGINQFLCKVFQHNKFVSPTPIQYYSIKTGIDNSQCSLVCRSKSGTGKTLSFIGLLINSLLLNNQIQNKTYSIILLPTRQLAVQVYQTLKLLLDSVSNIKAINQNEKNLKVRLLSLNIMLTIGGISFEDDRKKYRQNPSHIIISTVGRMWEMIKSNLIIMAKQMIIIFDEGDKLLTKVDQKLNKIILSVPKQARWFVFSATYTNKLLCEISKVKKCIYIETLFTNNQLNAIVTDKIQQILKQNSQVKSQSHTNQNKIYMTQNGTNNEINLHLQNIKKYHCKIVTQNNDSIFDSKIKQLCVILHELEYQKCLIFVEKKSFLEQISQSLSQQFEHVLIHGSLSQSARFRMMNQINSTKIIIASDLLSRGIDIKLDLVILFDARQTDTFWHRIGRTGRYGRTGVAISLDLIEQDKEWNDYNKQEINAILHDIQNFQKKQWYGGHLTEIGRWQQVDQKKQAQNNYRYFNQQATIKQISSIERSIKQVTNKQNDLEEKSKQGKIKGQVNHNCVKGIINKIKTKQQLKKLITQRILKCQKCLQLIHGTTALTGYQFQIIKYVQSL